MGGDDNIVGNGNTRLTYQNASAAVTVDLVGGTAHGTALGDVANVGTDTFSGVSRVIGSNFNDTITGDGNETSSRAARATTCSTAAAAAILRATSMPRAA